MKYLELAELARKKYEIASALPSQYSSLNAIQTKIKQHSQLLLIKIGPTKCSSSLILTLSLNICPKMPLEEVLASPSPRSTLRRIRQIRASLR